MSYSSQVLADSPDFYWLLNELAGPTAADSSGNGRTGTYGAGVTLGQPGIIPGETDTAAVFADVANSIVTAAAVATANYSGVQAFTLECWAKPTTVDATLRRIWNKSGAASAIAHYNRATGLTFERDSSGSGGADDLAGAAALVAGTAYHLACVFDPASSLILVYVNGNPAGSHASSAALGDLSANPFLVGDNGAGTRRFIGTIEKVAGYPRALSAATIAAHYAAAFPGSSRWSGSFRSSWGTDWKTGGGDDSGELG